MSLEIKETSQWWYARYRRNGKTRLINLGIKVEGERPDKGIGQAGDDRFERSRGKALAKHDQILDEIAKKNNAQELTQRIIQIKTGDRQQCITLDKLIESWERLPHRRIPCSAYLSCCRTTFQRFVDFLKSKHSAVEGIDDITSEMAREFMHEEEKRGVSPRTWNITLGLLRGLFKHLQPDADAYRRYLSTAQGKIEKAIHREPFSEEEIKAILDAAQDNEMMRPLIVTALCTAMRRGDCCLLEWKSVDLKNRLITVKASKTGETLEIPMMSLLYDELARTPRNDKKYVFPEAAKMYMANADGLNVRLSEILRRAGFVNRETVERIKAAEKGEIPTGPQLPPDELKKLGMSAIAEAKMISAKRQRMTKIFELYLIGRTMPSIAAEMNVSKGSVSCHLNEIEKMINTPIVRGRKQFIIPAIIRGSTQTEGSGPRLKLASVKGWHSFRTTWITLALTAGLPMELVRRVSGHTTADVVLKHYFRPGREQFRQALQTAMPKLLTNGAKTRDEQVLEILDNMSQKTWKQDSQAIRSLMIKQ
jgi:integrase